MNNECWEAWTLYTAPMKKNKEGPLESILTVFQNAEHIIDMLAMNYSPKIYLRE